MCVLKLGENDDIGAHVEKGEGIETACGSDHISTKTKTVIFQDVLEFDGRNSPFVPEQFCRFSSLPVFKMVFPTIASLHCCQILQRLTILQHVSLFGERGDWSSWSSVSAARTTSFYKNDVPGLAEVYSRLCWESDRHCHRSHSPCRHRLLALNMLGLEEKEKVLWGACSWSNRPGRNEEVSKAWLHWR